MREMNLKNEFEKRLSLIYYKEATYLEQQQIKTEEK